MLIILITCVVSGESILCDTCTCKNSIINCTENGLMDILDLWDHSDVLKDATLMHFDDNGIVHVKQLPPSKVRYLSLRKNKINKIDEMAFINLKLLLELDLSYNSLTAESLNPDIFKVGILLIFYLILLNFMYEIVINCVFYLFYRLITKILLDRAA